jgi:chemotaxis protein MotB
VVNAFPGSAGTSGEIEKELEEQIATMAGANDEGRKMSVLMDERGIFIRIMDKAFFDEGRAELKETAKSALLRIVLILERSNDNVGIEGHTDNMPINTQEFRSNWELSTRRATDVVRYLVEKHGFPPNRISASGYAEYRPVASNDTEQNRALNRRIEIILFKAGAAGS